MFETLFSGDAHLQLMQKSSELIKFMNDQKFFTLEHAEAIFAVTEKGVIDNKLAIYEILEEVSVYLDPKF